MKPGSDAYKQATKSLLTASAYGAACGLNPYQSRQQLWRIKTGREVFEGNDRTQYGIDNEPLAIAKYEAITGDLVSPGRFCTNPKYPNFGATPDAFFKSDGVLRDRLLEVKAPVSGLYKRIPVYYLAQIVGQMEITEVDFCDFFAWEPNEHKLWEVSRSPAAWEVMLPLLNSMVEAIRTDKEPPRFKKGEKLDSDEFRKLIEVEEVT